MKKIYKKFKEIKNNYNILKIILKINTHFNKT